MSEEKNLIKITGDEGVETPDIAGESTDTYGLEVTSDNLQKIFETGCGYIRLRKPIKENGETIDRLSFDFDSIPWMTVKKTVSEVEKKKKIRFTSPADAYTDLDVSIRLLAAASGTMLADLETMYPAKVIMRGCEVCSYFFGQLEGKQNQDIQ